MAGRPRTRALRLIRYGIRTGSVPSSDMERARRQLQGWVRRNPAEDIDSTAFYVLEGGLSMAEAAKKKLPFGTEQDHEDAVVEIATALFRRYGEKKAPLSVWKERLRQRVFGGGLELKPLTPKEERTPLYMTDPGGGIFMHPEVAQALAASDRPTDELLLIGQQVSRLLEELVRSPKPDFMRTHEEEFLSLMANLERNQEDLKSQAEAARKRSTLAATSSREAGEKRRAEDLEGRAESAKNLRERIAQLRKTAQSQRCRPAYVRRQASELGDFVEESNRRMSPPQKRKK